jgi:hypothetical protein
MPSAKSFSRLEDRFCQRLSRAGAGNFIFRPSSVVPALENSFRPRLSRARAGNSISTPGLVVQGLDVSFLFH